MSDDLSRYHRQTLLPGFGAAAQQRLRDATAVVLGCGALGSIAADMLARAGVGRLIILDRDFVELTNLQRQTLFDEKDVAAGLPKAEAARRKLAVINSQIEVTAFVDDINHTTLPRYAAGADILVDGLDNFETRYLANDYAVSSATPYVYGAAVGSTGMAMPILPHGDGSAAWETDPAGNLATPCFRCLFTEAPPPGSSPTCDTIGVLGPLVGLVANYEVSESLKILTGNYLAVNRRLLNVDLWMNELVPISVDATRDTSDCPCCKQRRFEYLDGFAGSDASSLCGRNAVQLRHRQGASVDLTSLAPTLRQHGTVAVNDFLLRLTVDADTEITLFADGRAIIKGTDDASTARTLYARYIGV